MKKISLLISTVVLFSLLSACASNEPIPNATSNANKVETIIAGTLSAIPTVTPTPVPSTPTPTELTDSLEWKIYSDPKFGFTLEYPATWIIIPREDKPGTFGEVLAFSYATSSIVISQYNKSISATDSLSEWTDKYNAEASMSSPDQIKTIVRQSSVVNGSEALFIRGASPEGEYQYTNIRRGEAVWFFWANFGEKADEINLKIYEHMLNSFKFGPSK